MNEIEKKNMNQNETSAQELSENELDDVTGGSAFENIPRVPVYEIDDNLKNKI